MDDDGDLITCLAFDDRQVSRLVKTKLCLTCKGLFLMNSACKACTDFDIGINHRSIARHDNITISITSHQF